MTTDADTVTASTQKFSLKSRVGPNGNEQEYVEGFVATTHTDKGNDQFTKQALQDISEDINEGSDVDAVFNDVDMDALREAQTGNLDHNNNPASPFGDTRTVPAFKITDAEVKQTDDDESGLYVKAMLNSDGMLPETVSAVKNSIKDGFLNAFSIEFVPKKVEQKTIGEKVVRVIKSAVGKGAALTGRPMNPMAKMTEAQLKSLSQEYKVEYAYSVGEEVEWGETSGTVRDRTKDSCFNSEIDGDFEVCGSEEEPAYLIEVDNDEGTMVGHKQDTLSAKGSYMDKNDISPMTDDEQVSEEEPEPEDEVKSESEEGEPEEPQEKQSDEEGKSMSLTEDVEELKTVTQDLKSTNEELREENEELKSELEDLRQLQEIKSEVDEVKSILDEVQLEDGPRARQEQKNRFDDDQETKADWKQAVDRVGKDYLKSDDYLEAFAENQDTDIEEVKNYVNSN